MKKRAQENKVKSQELHLPPLISRHDFYVDEKGSPKFEKTLSVHELGEKIEQWLLDIPDFRPPNTTANKPAHIVNCSVSPKPDKDGVFTFTIDFLPGYKADGYPTHILSNKEYYKDFEVSDEYDTHDVAKWLRELIYENEAFRQDMFCMHSTLVPHQKFHVKLKVTQQDDKRRIG